MTEEIKEKLEAIASDDDIDLLWNEANDLLNYITNLQKENERIGGLYEAYEEANSLWIKKCEDYKQRNEKAVEYIKQHCDRPGKLLLPKIDFNYNDLLNILEGGDE